MKNKKKLKDGFTTGTAATAATMAAFNLLLNNIKDYELKVPLPPFFYQQPLPNNVENYVELNQYDNHFFQSHDYNTICTKGMIAKKCIKIPILRIDYCSQNTAQAEVEKNGGDDPDVTKHAHIISTVKLIHTTTMSQDLNYNNFEDKAPIIYNKDINTYDIDYTQTIGDIQHSNNNHELYVNIDAENGIGRVTMPGLSVPVGFAAINPIPRLQIACGLHLIAAQRNFSGQIEVKLSVPNGEKLAKRTLNSRLGIIGGISILGTQGIVKPYSHAAWKDTIIKCLDMAKHINREQICFCTGRRSERLIMKKYPHLATQSFIQSADFVGFSLEEAHKRKFEKIIWACFFGKFLKLAEGHFYTHALSSELNINFLVKYCEKHQASCTKSISTCLTAAHALEILLQDKSGMHVLYDIAQKAADNAQNFAKQKVQIHLFHIQGNELLYI